MQYRPPQHNLTQADLFHNALMASGYTPAAERNQQQPALSGRPQSAASGCSEMTLSGTPEQCLLWLAPVLRELANAPGSRWLTLLNPPALISHSWLRTAGLDPQRILIVRSKSSMSTARLCQDLLQLGCSHTVVSWLECSPALGEQLDRAARNGGCHHLNIRMP